MHVAFQSGEQFLSSTEPFGLLTLFYDIVVNTLNTALFYFVIFADLILGKSYCKGRRT